VRRFRTAVTIALGVGIAAVLLAACSSNTPSASNNNTGNGSKVSGGTVTWAEPPSDVPNFIFPFMSLAFFSVTNLSQFQQLMYRPLYWFGKGASASLDPSLSLAQTPVYSDNNTTAVINLKNYKWSNGETVTATDIMFWMNMMHAEKTNWAAYAPGTFPDNIKSITINSPTQLTFVTTKPYNPLWLTYNQFSQITPMPKAWDITATGGAPGSGGCSGAAYGTADTACAAVYTFLSKQAGYDPANAKGANNSLTTYATNPLWQVVDGPWHLTHFDASGDVTMVPNPTYSGPIKPTISVFKEVPFTSDSAEFNSLVAGNIDFGYLPTQDITAPAKSPLVAGANNPRLSDFALAPLYLYGINYFPYNFNSTGDNGNAGKIFNQPYFRQAMQDLVDQPLFDNKVFKGYAVPTYGPVPVIPPTYASKQEQDNPYPYNPAKAKSLLTSHGWKVVPSGTSTCTDAGSGASQCGAGIPAGAELNFNLQYATGTTWITQLMNTEKSSWAQAGINITLSSASFDTVLGIAVPCTGGSSCTWELQDWGGGWEFSPDYYPTGEEIFSTGAGSNSGSYSNATNDANTDATNASAINLDKYQNFLATDLPVIWQPNPAYSMSEISNKLHGATPQNVFGYLTPENWYLTK
jgi:peptide/nickel transport system substrate-binding protein